MKVQNSRLSFHGRNTKEKTQRTRQEGLSLRLNNYWNKACFGLPKFCAIASMSLLFSSCSFLTQKEEIMQFDELPAKIQQLARAEIGNNAIVQVERESRFGKSLYAINYTVEDIEWELEYSIDGKMLDKSVELDSGN